MPRERPGQFEDRNVERQPRIMAICSASTSRRSLASCSSSERGLVSSGFIGRSRRVPHQSGPRRSRRPQQRPYRCFFWVV
jgi:hypothetical protein